MNFDNLQQGDQIFIDANIFVYHFGKLSEECKTLLSRCARKEIRGFTAVSILAEVLHRLMIAEAIEKKLILEKNPVKQLKAHPETIKYLSAYQENVAKIDQMNITILDVKKAHIRKSAQIRLSEGLLTNDSIAIAVMTETGLSNLATNDDDFDDIAGIHVFKPTDI